MKEKFGCFVIIILFLMCSGVFSPSRKATQVESDASPSIWYSVYHTTPPYADKLKKMTNNKR